MAAPLALRPRVLSIVRVPVVIVLALAFLSPPASGLRQAVVQSTGVMLTKGNGTTDKQAKLDEPLAKPALQLTFYAVFNSSAGELQDVGADAGRLAIFVRNTKAGSRARASGPAVGNGNSSAPHDGMILDFGHGRRFSHQRFFNETVCYEMDLGPGEDGAVGAVDVLGDDHGNSSGRNASSAGSTAADTRRRFKEAAFRAALGEILGAPLELYPAARAPRNGPLREVAGQHCATWVANRTDRQPLLQVAAGSLAAMGWRSPPSAAIQRAVEAAEKNPRLAETETGAVEAVLEEASSFCVTAEGEVLATSYSRRMSIAKGNDSFSLWQMSQEAAVTSAPSRGPDPKVFDSRRGIAGGRCVDLTQGSTGPSELGVALNAEHRLARINKEAAGHWEAAPNALWDGVTVAEVRPALGTEMRPLQLPLRSHLMGGVLSVGAGSFGAPEMPPPPESFDARRHWPECLSIGLVQNQGACGSCWAFSAVSVLADRFCVAAAAADGAASRKASAAGSGADALLQGSVAGRLGLLSLAPEHLVDCDHRNNGCSGGRLDDAWRFLREHGVPDEACTPYRFCKVPTAPKCAYGDPGAAEPSTLVGREHGAKGQCAGTCKGGEPMHLFRAGMAYAVAPPGDLLGLQRELLANGPVQVAFFVFSDFHNYHHGVYFRTQGAYGPLGGHAVRMLGWGSAPAGGGGEVDYWLVANSWSTLWGMSGLFRIRRGTNECGIETTPAAGLPELGAAAGPPRVP